MADPLIETSLTVQKALGAMRTLKMSKNIYCDKIMEDASYTDIPPKMIFLPDQALVRYMIKGMVTKGANESTDDFMLKYGYCNPIMVLHDKFRKAITKKIKIMQGMKK